ncbi:hypothetical protein POM88_018420 [Heracleum sosnowskyi]|uniref:phosphogluconate dehydrogenase (NADP(+)-dependent, decarboxylating) n=1 Tax=Heracleum sosnowskyi TaxID=360622 RepID=A0AAD8MZA5_9APIA|nr:hypothetical protein POM88_018420 [Heracleum sosnowskyi]
MNLIRANSIEMGWGLTFGELARIWKGGCIISDIFLDRIKQAYDRNTDLASLLVDPDDLCVLNITPISEKQEAVFGHDDEIVTLDKNYPDADDFLVLTSTPISEKQEASGLVSKLFGNDDKIVAIDKCKLLIISTTICAILNNVSSMNATVLFHHVSLYRCVIVVFQHCKLVDIVQTLKLYSSYEDQ